MVLGYPASNRGSDRLTEVLVVMNARKHPRMRRASRFVGLAMILGITVALTASIGTMPAQATPAPAWTAYVAGGGPPGTVALFKTATNAVGTPIATGGAPVGIAITPNGATAFVTNDSFANTVTPIDTATNTAETPIPVGSTPDSIAITPNGATAYVVNSASNNVTPIDTATNTAGTPIAVGPGPGGIAITPNGETAYVTDDASDGVTPIDLTTNTAGTPISVGSSPGSIAITPNGVTAYVTNPSSNTVTPIHTATNTVGTPIPAGIDPGAIAITPNGATAYVANGFSISDGLTPIDTATNTAGTFIPLDASLSPTDIAITPDGATAYVGTNAGSTAAGMVVFPVQPIDTATNLVDTPISLGQPSFDIAITPDQAPVAQLSVATTEADQPTKFDASASTVAFGTISTYAWNFGDGSTATTVVPTTSHTYATPGPYTATVTETDSAGTSTTHVFTGQTMSRNGGPSAVASQSFTVAPSTLAPCASGLQAHALRASYGTSTFTGLFCVNAKGVGTYSQGTVQGIGTITVVEGVTSISAFGKNLALVGVTNGTHSGFIEFAPAPIKLGTFTLS